MNKKFTLPLLGLMAIFFIASCVKDKLTKTYTLFTPVYKSRAEVIANIKASPSQSIKNAGKFFLYDHYLFLNEIDKGIHIIDNSDPVNPKNIAFINLPGNDDIAVKDHILYADFYADLVTIDITNPLQAKLKKILRNVFPPRRFVNNNGFVSDSGRVIIDWLRRDTVVDVDLNANPTWNCPNCVFDFLPVASSLASAQKAYTPPAIGGSMAKFALVRSDLYVVDENNLAVFSTVVPEEPVLTKRVSIGWGIETLYPFKDKLFIGSNLGMFIYDISDGSTPHRVGQFSHARVCDPVIADDDFAFVTLRTGTSCTGASVNINQLDVINVSNLSSPYLVKSYSLHNPHGLSKDAGLLFICDGTEGLKVFDAANVEKLKLIKQFGGFESYDVITYNHIAMVVEKSGIRQFDYSNPSNIRYLSKISW